jgi:hypothetical protein
MRPLWHEREVDVSDILFTVGKHLILSVDLGEASLAGIIEQT